MAKSFICYTHWKEHDKFIMNEGKMRKIALKTEITKFLILAETGLNQTNIALVKQTS